MQNATTIVPIGTFTPDLWGRVRETALARAQQGEVIIALPSTQRMWWNALNGLAEALRMPRTPYAIRLAGARPRTRALLRELGVDHARFVGEPALGSSTRIVIRVAEAHG
jgi:hypothetical protein